MRPPSNTQNQYKGNVTRITIREGVFTSQNPEDFRPDSNKGEPPLNCLKEIDFKHLQYVLALLVPQNPGDPEIDYHRVVK